MKHRKKKRLISKSEKQRRKELRRATKRKNWWYHHKWQIIADATGRVRPSIIRFTKTVHLLASDETIFQKINEAENKECVCFKFSAVQNIDVGSMLYVKAFIDKKKAEGVDVRVSCSKQNSKMRQILQHMKLKNYNLRITYNDIRCWTVKEWYEYSKENYVKVLMKEILPNVLKGKIPNENFANIASSLTELLANCSEHAYLEGDDFKGYYLIAGEYENMVQGKSNEFSFCILDMGQGFRDSLHKNTQFTNFIKQFGILSDDKIIKAAVEGKFNANTDKTAGRGTGLPDVKKKVESINGSLHIYSNKGTYLYNNGSETLKMRKHAVIGSIITVTLPIN